MDSKPKVFVSRVIPQIGLDMIQAECDADIWPDPLPPSAAILRDKCADCVGLVSLLTDRIDSAFLDAVPNLKVISNFAVGFNNIDVEAATQRGIAVGNTPGVLTDATADMAMTLMLAAARRLTESVTDAREGRWRTWEPCGWLGQDLAGRTVGIVGMGRIGFAVAKRCRLGWGMNVLYSDLYENKKAEEELAAQKVEFDQLLAESDFISLHTILDDSTRGMFGAEQFQKMKPSAVLVNTARGPLIDHAALVDGLKSKTIFAAGLDVTDPEPLPPDHELYSLSNCVIAPHIASATVQTRDAMAKICAENLLAGLRGEPLPCPVKGE